MTSHRERGNLLYKSIPSNDSKKEPAAFYLSQVLDNRYEITSKVRSLSRQLPPWLFPRPSSGTAADDTDRR
jgi:hypothetical protein